MAAHAVTAMRRAIVSRRSRIWSASWMRTKAIGGSSTADTQFSVVHPGVTADWVIVRLATRASADVLAQERDVVLSAVVGGFADHRRVGGPHDRNQQLWVDLTGAEIGVPVRTRARGVTRSVAVHKADAAGDAHEPRDCVDEFLARSPGMAG